MNKEDNNELIKEIILSQKNFHLLPRDEGGYCVYIGDLYCDDKQLTMLPDNLKVGGDLYCEYNQLTTLPDGLVVGGYLICIYNQLTSIPDDLYVRYNLYCYDNKITNEIKADIGGKVIMDDEQQNIYDRVIKLNRLKVLIDG